MASTYADATWALGLCDRCGFTYKLNELHKETYNLRLTGLKVCGTCLDQDHPQLQKGKQIIDDPQNLYDPRPDTGEANTIGLFGWAPVGHTTLQVEVSTGSVTVTTN